MKLSSLFKRRGRKNSFETALAQYRETAERNPQDLRLRVKIAHLCLEYGRKSEAVEEYLSVARAYQAKKVFPIAVAMYNHALDIEPGRVSIYTDLANLHLRNGFVGDGVVVLEKLAHHYHTQGMTFEATQVLEKIREIDPGNEFFRQKVDRFYQTRAIDREASLKAGPQDKWELVDAAGPQPAAQAPKESFFDLAAAIDDEMQICIDAEQTGDASGDGMEPEQVFSALRSMMGESAGQDTPEFHFNLGVACQRCGQYDQACEEFEQALADGHPAALCCVHLAECAIACQRYDRALEHTRRGMAGEQVTPEERTALLYQAALAHRASGDLADALKLFKKVKAADPDFPNVDTQIMQLSA